MYRSPFLRRGGSTSLGTRFVSSGNLQIFYLNQNDSICIVYILKLESTLHIQVLVYCIDYGPTENVGLTLVLLK